MEIVSSQLPNTSWTVPWVHTLFENAAAVASGIEAGMKALTRKGIKDMSGVKAIAMAGDGGTSDIGLQALSGALERGHDFIYFCFDNEAYMNTGIQRSSSTPYGATTTTSPAGKASIGQITWKKNMAAIAVAHDIPYVATACPAFHRDLVTKIRKAIETKGPSYIHILSPCPTGWRCPTDNAVEVGRMAVQCGMFPLYEVVNGKYSITVKPEELKPVNDYIKAQGRFRHLTDREIGHIQQKVDQEWGKLNDLVAMTNPATPAA